MSLGEVEGAFHPSVLFLAQVRNIRSSRREKEQIRLKTSESGVEGQVTRRVLRVGDNPCKGTKET